MDFEPKTLQENWVEVLAAAIMVLALVVSLLLRNVLFGYVTIVLAGLIAGRIYYIKRFSQPILPSILIIVGFLLGYLIGGFWGSRFGILLFFGAAFGISYYLHLKKIIVIFKSEKFIK